MSGKAWAFGNTGGGTGKSWSPLCVEMEVYVYGYLEVARHGSPN